MLQVGLKVSIFCWIATFAIISAHELRNECVSLEISGSVYHLNTNGIYFLKSDNLCNSRHQWIHESGEHYLYYVLDGYDGWMIGTWSCHWGNFVISVKSNNEEPYNLPEIWKEFIDEKSSWKNNTELRVQCVDGVRYNSESANCQMMPCQNDASCVNSNDASKCLCHRGFYGRFCETAIDTNHCRSSPCQNGASCSDLVNDFQCNCAAGFAGRQCDILTDDIDCNAWPCHERCSKFQNLSCYSIRDIIAVACFCAIVIIVILALTLVARYIYLKQRTLVVQDGASLEEESLSWKDVSYKRLESLDSVLTLDRVGV